jgi:hypothetical protein
VSDLGVGCVAGEGRARGGRRGRSAARHRGAPRRRRARLRHGQGLQVRDSAPPWILLVGAGVSVGVGGEILRCAGERTFSRRWIGWVWARSPLAAQEFPDFVHLGDFNSSAVLDRCSVLRIVSTYITVGSRVRVQCDLR